MTKKSTITYLGLVCRLGDMATENISDPTILRKVGEEMLSRLIFFHFKHRIDPNNEAGLKDFILGNPEISDAIFTGNCLFSVSRIISDSVNPSQFIRVAQAHDLSGYVR